MDGMQKSAGTEEGRKQLVKSNLPSRCACSSGILMVFTSSLLDIWNTCAQNNL